MKRYCLALGLVEDASLIAEYENWHKPGNGWPEIKKNQASGIKKSGIINHFFSFD